MDGVTVDISHLTSAELAELISDARALIEKRAEIDGARGAAQAAVEAYATAAGLTILQAWRDLVPEGVQVPDDPDPAPAPDAPAYVQPTGAHDAYQAGDRVTFQGRVYEAVINAVVWSPLAYPQAWKEVR